MNPDIQLGITVAVQRTEQLASKFEDEKDFANAALMNLKISYLATFQQFDPTVKLKLKMNFFNYLFCYSLFFFFLCLFNFFNY